MLDLAVPLKVERQNRWMEKNARVAERQTRWLQVPVSERAWGFKSPLAHVFEKDPDATYGSVGVFLYARTFVFLTMVQCSAVQSRAEQGSAEQSRAGHSPRGAGPVAGQDPQPRENQIQRWNGLEHLSWRAEVPQLVPYLLTLYYLFNPFTTYRDPARLNQGA